MTTGPPRGCARARARPHRRSRRGCGTRSCSRSRGTTEARRWRRARVLCCTPRRSRGARRAARTRRGRTRPRAHAARGHGSDRQPRADRTGSSPSRRKTSSTASGPPSSERAGASAWRATRKRRAASAVTLTRRTLSGGSRDQPAHGVARDVRVGERSSIDRESWPTASPADPLRCPDGPGRRRSSTSTPAAIHGNATAEVGDEPLC